MKTPWFLFLMIAWATLLQGTSFARPSGQASEQTQSQSRSSGVTSTNGNEDTPARGENHQTGKHSDDQNSAALATNGTAQHRASVGRPKQVLSRQVRSVKTQGNNHRRTDRLATAGDPRPIDPSQTDRSRSLAVPNRALTTRRLPVRTPAVAALSGQDFKNTHNSSASLAVSGGPANSPRNTAAINGTNMKRKP